MESKYQIIVRWSDEDAAYIAKVPELSGCKADGQTRQDAVTNVERAIQNGSKEPRSFAGRYRNTETSLLVGWGVRLGF